jgi:hypothetical protein
MVAPESGFKKQDFNEGTIDAKILSSLKLKATTTDIKRFEMTPYVADKANHTNFNFLQFVQGLTTTLASFKSGSSNGGTSSGGTSAGNITTGGSIDPETGKPYTTSPTVVEAGISGIAGFLLLAGAAAIAFGGMKDKPATRPATVVATRPAQRRSSTKKTR